MDRSESESMEISVVQGRQPEWILCSDVKWDVSSFTRDGRSVTRDYLVFDFGNGRTVRVPSSNSEKSAWGAFKKVFGESTGTQLNGNVVDAFKGKELQITHYSIVYGPSFSEERALVTGVRNPGETGEQKNLPAATDESLSTAKQIVKEYLAANDGKASFGNICAHYADRTKSKFVDKAEDAIRELMDCGDVMEPVLGIIKLVEPATEKPVTTEKTVPSPVNAPQPIPHKDPYLDAVRAVSSFIEDFSASTEAFNRRMAALFYTSAKAGIKTPQFIVGGPNTPGILYMYKDKDAGKATFMLGTLITEGVLIKVGQGVSLTEGYIADIVDGAPRFVSKVQEAVGPG